MVSTPDVASLTALLPTLADLVVDGRIRLLDLAVAERDVEGAIAVHEVETVGIRAARCDVEGDIGGLLSQQDVTTAGHALRPGTAGLVVLIESRWAEPLSEAARGAGGHIVGGDRIPSRWVTDALAQRRDDDDQEPT